MITIDEIEILDISTVLMPAVLDATDWNIDANMFVPISKSFILWLYSMKNMNKNPNRIKIGVNAKTIFEWSDNLYHENFFSNWVLTSKATINPIPPRIIRMIKTRLTKTSFWYLIKLSE